MTDPGKDRLYAIAIWILCIVMGGAFLALHEMGVW